MDFLSQHWFQIITLVILGGGWLVQHGASKQRNTTVVEEIGKLTKKVGDLEEKVDADIKNFQAHVANPDIHVNSIMMKLFDERFDFIKQQQADTRTDISRLENILTSK